MDLNVKLYIDYQNDRIKLYDKKGVDGDYADDSLIKGMFKIVGPAGVIYVNAGWDTDDYSAPDVNGSTADWSTDYIDVPVNTSGVMTSGIYTVYYKMKEAGTAYSDSVEYNFSYTPPTGKISVEVQLSKSRMKLTDSTTYTLNTGYGWAEQQNDLNNERTWTARYPLGAGIVSQTGHASPFYVGPNLWSGNFDVLMVCNINYLFDVTIDNVTFLTVEIDDKITAKKDDIYVMVGDCMSNVLTCLTNLIAKYELALNQNFDERDKLKELIDRIQWYVSAYNIAVLTGTDTDYYCDKLKTILTECGCSTNTDQLPSEEILASAGESGAGTGSIAFYLYKYTGTEAGISTISLPITLTADTPVFINGSLAVSGVDYTGIDTKTITFLSPKTADDQITIMSTEYAT